MLYGVRPGTKILFLTGFCMNQLNSIILEGNVVRQGELSEPAKGFKVCKFPMAVNRFTKSSNGDFSEEVSFFDVEAYGKMAEICEKNTIKGRGVRVVGRLKQNRWKDNDGKNQSKIIVVAEHCEYKPKANAEDGTKAEGSKEIRKEYSIEKAKESLDSAYAKADGYSVPEEETADETKVITEGQEKEEAVF